jgi:hypothetical protein
MSCRLQHLDISPARKLQQQLTAISVIYRQRRPEALRQEVTELRVITQDLQRRREFQLCVYERVNAWWWETTTKKDFLQVLYKMYLKTRSPMVAEKWYDITNTCSWIKLEVMFAEEWPREKWPESMQYLNLILRARAIEKMRAGCRAKEQNANKGVEAGKSVSGEEWLAEWRRKTQDGGNRGSTVPSPTSHQFECIVEFYY